MSDRFGEVPDHVGFVRSVLVLLNNSFAGGEEESLADLGGDLSYLLMEAETRMKIVREFVQEEFGIKKKAGSSPEESQS